MAIVFGTVTRSGRAQGRDLTVRAYDRDMRSEQFLGGFRLDGSATYRIEYDETMFGRAEKKTADLIVRVHDADGQVLAASETVFNAGPEERIDLVIEPRDTEPRTRSNELDLLRAALEGIREGVPYDAFDASDRRFLTEEIIRAGRLGDFERRTVAQQLEFLTIAARSAERTGVILDAFYGCFRQDLPTRTSELFQLPAERVRRAIATSIAERIIPDISRQIEEFLDRFAAQAIGADAGSFWQAFAVLVSIDADGVERPRAGLTVTTRAVRADTDSAPLSRSISDSAGRATIGSFVPRDAGASVSLVLTVEEDGTPLHETEITVPLDTDDPAELRVVLPADPGASVRLDALASADLAQTLSDAGLETVEDLLGADSLPGDDTDGLEALRGQARWSVLKPDLDDAARAAVVEEGLGSLQSLTASGLVGAIDPLRRASGGDAQAFAFYTAAADQARLFDHQVNGAWISNKTAPDDDDGDDGSDLPDGIPELFEEADTCGCEDCLSAVSPAAYLAMLLDWVLVHVRDGDAEIDFADLQRDLHQPFGALPASCAAVEEMELQVRLACEALWSFTDLRDTADLSLPSPVRLAYRAVRNKLYVSILAQMGVDFDQLRRATLVPGDNDADVARIAQERRSVAARLGIDESRLAEIFFNVEQPPISPSENELQALFGYRSTRISNPATVVATPQIVEWQNAQMDAFWQSMDHPDDRFTGPDPAPFVDPALLSVADFRTPLDENPAFALFSARGAALDAHREAMSALDPLSAGLQAAVQATLGVGMDTLEGHADALTATDPDSDAVRATQDALAALNLSQAALTELVRIDADITSSAVAELAPEDREAELETLLDILSGVHRLSLHAEWVAEEANDSAFVFGPRLFWPVAPGDVSVNTWRAFPGERLAWEAALETRSQPPIIDPDRVPLDAIQALNADAPNALRAVALWEERRAFTDDRLDALVAAEQGAATAADRLEAALAASTLGLDTGLLEELAASEAAGASVALELSRHGLTMLEYRFLDEVRLRAASSGAVSADDREEVRAILVQAEKRRLAADWRAEEAADPDGTGPIVLSPDLFALPDPAPDVPSDPARARLFDQIADQRWTDTLAARQEQRDALRSALSAAVAAAEEAHLPTLRNILIDASSAEGNSLAGRAAWLDGRLLMDMAMGGCARTSRVAHAIETLQRLVRGIYTQDHMPVLRHLTLAVSNFEAEWRRIGTYRDWRAGMLVYLFPENSLHVTPMVYQTEAYRTLKADLPRELGPEAACDAARGYSDYFRDVSNLRTEAQCSVLARVPGTCRTGRSHHRVLTFLLARSQETGNVYIAAQPTVIPNNLIYNWSRVRRAASVVKILGAVPHTTPRGKRYIVLFVLTEAVGDRFLEYLTYDLDDLTWSKRRQLKLPHGRTSGFRVAVIQKRPSAVRPGQNDFDPARDFETIVAFQDWNNTISIRSLDANADGWASAGWRPLHWKGLSEYRFLNEPIRLRGMLQRNASEYVVVIENVQSRQVLFRNLSTDLPGNDDLRWRRLQDIGNYRGLLALPLSQRIHVFSNDGAWMHSQIIQRAGDLDTETRYAPGDGFGVHDDLDGFNDFAEAWTGDDNFIRSRIRDFNEDWLENRVGVSLRDIDLSDLEVPLFVPSTDHEGQEVIYPINPPGGVEQVPGNYSIRGLGSFLDVLLMERNALDYSFHSEARYRDRAYYLMQVLHAGFAEFAKQMKGVSSADRLGGRGGWRLAHEYVRSLSTQSDDSLVAFVERLVHNRIWHLVRYMVEWNRSFLDVPRPLAVPGLENAYTPAFLRSRAGDENGPVRQMLGNWTIPPLSGDGNFTRGPSSDQTLALAQKRATYLCEFKRDGNGFTYFAPNAPMRVTPDNDGPYAIAPARDLDDLVQRKEEIKSVYMRNGKAMVNASLSARTILREAHSLVPIHLGLQLQRAGNYDTALGYFRLVYDDRQPAGKRRIDHVLELERSLPFAFEDAEEYVADGDNAHVIARTRKNTYTRQILLILARCMIEEADTLFSRDTADGNSQARMLYAKAQELLGYKALRPGTSACANILGELEVELVEGGDLPVLGLISSLHRLTRPAHLAETARNLRAVNAAGGPRTDRIGAMRAILADSLAAEPGRPAMETLRTRQRDRKRRIEDRLIAHRPTRRAARMTMQRREARVMASLAEATGTNETALVATALPWLVQREMPDAAPPAPTVNLSASVFVADPDTLPRGAEIAAFRAAQPLAALNAMAVTHFAAPSGVSFDFCVPQNPVIQALADRAKANLYKLRTCRNFAGLVRPADPYGAPIGIGAGMVSADGRIFDGVVEQPATIYSYRVLFERAQQLASIAQQMEAGYQSALERAEAEAFSVLQAEQGVELAQSRVSLQDLRISVASQEIGLVRLQRKSAALRQGTFANRVATGAIDHERALLDAYRDAGRAQRASNTARTTGQVAGLTLAAMSDTAQAKGPISKIVMAVAQGSLRATQIGAAVAEGIYNARAIDAGTRAQVQSFEAGLERQMQDWRLQQGLAAIDIEIADQQEVIARGQMDLVVQERAIAELEQTHAVDVLKYLTSKFFTEEMYLWISGVLNDVYRFFLQEATNVALLAQRQVAFERQEAQLRLIQPDYTSTPVPANILSGDGVADRRGLTGSARLLRDLHKVDSYAFETRQRDQSLSLNFDLAELYPLSFQRFRETGLLDFSLPLSMIDEEMPGYYLTLLRDISVSVVALIDPTRGIRGRLTFAGVSRTVVRTSSGTFEPVIIRGLPETIALTAPHVSASGATLEPDSAALRGPFEGVGLDAMFQLSMAKDANPMDYNSIATVVVTAAMTARHDPAYEARVRARQGRTRTITRAFDMRDAFPAAHYDLRNPGQTPTPMSVRFATQPEDFPPNITNLRIDAVVLYFVRRSGATFEQDVQSLSFSPDGVAGQFGGSATTVDGKISTRAGNGTTLLPLIGLPPTGEWHLSFADNPPAEVTARERFAQDDIETIILALTVSGDLPR